MGNSLNTGERPSSAWGGHAGVPCPSKNVPPPEDPPRALGIGLQYGPREVRFLVSEVPLHHSMDEGSLTPDSGVPRGRMCTTYGLKVHCVGQVKV